MQIKPKKPYICPMNVIKQTTEAAGAEYLVRRRAEGSNLPLTQKDASMGLAWLVFWKSIGEMQEARIREIWEAEKAGKQKPPKAPVFSSVTSVRDGRYKHGEPFNHIICNTYLAAFRSGKKVATLDQIALMAKHVGVNIGPVQAMPTVTKIRKRTPKP